MVTLRIPGQMGVWLPSLYATTFYLPYSIVRQFDLLHDAFEDASIELLNGLFFRPSTIATFSTACQERIAAPFQRVLA